MVIMMIRSILLWRLQECKNEAVYTRLRFTCFFWDYGDKNIVTITGAAKVWTKYYVTVGCALAFDAGMF
jgi:hypothetical protein